MVGICESSDDVYSFWVGSSATRFNGDGDELGSSVNYVVYGEISPLTKSIAW